VSELLEVLARQVNDTARRVDALEDALSAVLDGLIERDEQVQFRLSAMAGDIERLHEMVADGIARVLAADDGSPHDDGGEGLPVPTTVSDDNADEGERGAEEFARVANA
jgi:hypothetical protein